MEKTHDFEIKAKSADRASANENERSASSADLISVQPPVFQLKAESTSEKEETKEENTSAESTYQLAAEGIAPPPNSPNDGADDQSKPNNTGLPTQLKTGVENLSGFSLDDVKVHYNSDKPAQLKAHAYAQGTDIHVASGQERHLPHEAWHVVQQKQGRVQPTTQLKGINVNDDNALETEADRMGAKALQSSTSGNPGSFQLKAISNSVVQRAKNSEDDLLRKMGNYKFTQAKKKSLLHVFEDMSDEKLEEIKNQTRKSFDNDLAYGFLEREELQDAEPQTYLGMIMSRFGWGGGEGEGDLAPERTNIPIVEEFAQGERNTGGFKQSLAKETAAALFEEDPEEEGASLADMILSQIEIDLGSKKIPEDSSMSLGRLGEGEAEGSMSAKGSMEGFKGEAKIEIKAGKGGKTKKGFGTFGSDSTNVAAGGTIEGHIGAKAGLEGSAEYNPLSGKAKLKGKAGASLGASSEGSVQIMIRGGGMDLGKFAAKGGMMLGIGGEFTYIAKWDGGQFTLGSSGKAAVGLGFTWGYKMQVNAPGMLAKLGDKLSSWARWGMDVLSYIE